MNFEEAKKLALKVSDEYTLCLEYEDGFVFCFKEDEGHYDIGGGVQPVGILKKTGETVSYPLFITESTMVLIGEYYLEPERTKDELYRDYYEDEVITLDDSDMKKQYIEIAEEHGIELSEEKKTGAGKQNKIYKELEWDKDE